MYNSVTLHPAPHPNIHTHSHYNRQFLSIPFNFHRKVPQLFLKWAPQYFHVDVKTQRLPNQTKMFEPSIVRSFIHVFGVKRGFYACLGEFLYIDKSSICMSICITVQGGSDKSGILEV